MVSWNGYDSRECYQATLRALLSRGCKKSNTESSSPTQRGSRKSRSRSDNGAVRRVSFFKYFIYWCWIMKTILYDILKQKVHEDKEHIWLFATASRALFSRGIRKATNTKVSHVGFLLFFFDRLWVVEMMEGAWCRIVPASNRLKNEKFVQVGRIKTDMFQSDFIKSILADVYMVQYDLIGAILSPFIDTKTGQMFCSEWVAKKAQIQFSTLNRGIFPSDVMEKCEYHPYQLIF